MPDVTPVDNPVPAGPSVPNVAGTGADATRPTVTDLQVLAKTATNFDLSSTPGGLARTGSVVVPSLVLGRHPPDARRPDSPLRRRGEADPPVTD